MVYEKELDVILEKMAIDYDKTEEVEGNKFTWHIAKNKEENTWIDKEGRLRNDIKLNIVITESYAAE